MFQERRAIVTARREISDTVAAAFLPFEQSVNDAATKGALCYATALQAHAAANLGPSVGREAVELLSEASRLAAMARDNVVRAHDLLRDLPAQHNLPTAGGANCPPNEAREPLVMPFVGAVAA